MRDPSPKNQKSRVSFEFGHIADILNKTDDQTDMSGVKLTDLPGTDKPQVKTLETFYARRLELLERSMTMASRYLSMFAEQKSKAKCEILAKINFDFEGIPEKIELRLAQAKSIDEEIPVDELHEMINQMYRFKLLKRLASVLIVQSEKQILDSLKTRMEDEMAEIKEAAESLLQDISASKEKAVEARKNQSFWCMLKDYMGVELLEFNKDLLNSKKYQVRFCLCSNYFLKAMVV